MRRMVSRNCSVRVLPAAATQVGVNQDDALAGLGQHDRQVRGRGRFAFVDVGAGYDDRLHLAAVAGEADVGAELAVRLGWTRLRAGFEDVSVLLKALDAGED